MIMMNLLLSMIFMFLKHPMTMGLTLLMQTILISMITGMLNQNFWFSYILFLIMIGGMLVLFIYMTSIASNEMFSYNIKMMMSFYMFLIISTTYLFFSDQYLYMMKLFMNNNLLMNNYTLILTKFFNYPSMLMVFFMIIYLFITLIAVVKITKINYGPLRQKF